MLGDAKVQQANGPAVLHKDVRWFQIAMDHRSLMRVDYRLADSLEEFQPFSQRGPVRAAILHKRYAFNVLHDKKRSAVRRCVSVVQPRNERMIQLCQRALFRGKTLAARGRQPRVSKDLDGNQAAKVLPLGKVHHSHAAFPEYFLDSVRAELL